ncbi:antifungal protein ginkbilobin-like protein [Salvia miltiorrhiza]|uniref:antifungal protein ginkbilobin-like protein n=1 Tax=Salvia miltiorrhiza TaxID=226208 RepID=UPI0025AD3A07|nr:antifungal protein ginkbilobin-like protein [Salvia miltiorrhiza]
MASMKLKMTIVVIMGVLLGAAESTPNININEWRCNADSYSETDAYAGNVDYVLTDLMYQTPNAPAYYYFTQSPSNTAICYGQAICNIAISNNDCNDCLIAADSNIKIICNDKIGAMLEMVDCTIRYENYPF